MELGKKDSIPGTRVYIDRIPYIYPGICLIKPLP